VVHLGNGLSASAAATSSTAAQALAQDCQNGKEYQSTANTNQNQVDHNGDTTCLAKSEF
jgi:hypothetical protein